MTTKTRQRALKKVRIALAKMEEVFEMIEGEEEFNEAPLNLATEQLLEMEVQLNTSGE